MENNCKRFLSLLLALVMVLGMFPVGHAHATEEETVLATELVTTVEANESYLICLNGTERAMTNQTGEWKSGYNALALANSLTPADNNMWTLEAVEGGYKLRNGENYMTIAMDAAGLDATGNVFVFTYDTAAQNWYIKANDVEYGYFNHLGGSGYIGGWNGTGTRFDVYKVVEKTMDEVDPWGKRNWVKVSVDSEAVNKNDSEGEFEKAFDRNSGTIWHSNYPDDGNDKVTGGENTIAGEINFGQAYTINHFSFTPRVGSASGQVTQASLYVKLNEADEWKLVAEHVTFAADGTKKNICFEEQAVQFVRFVAENASDGWVAVSEFDIGNDASVHTFVAEGDCTTGFVCSVCGAKTADGAETHTLDAGTVADATVTYTCTVEGCEYSYEVNSIKLDGLSATASSANADETYATVDKLFDGDVSSGNYWTTAVVAVSECWLIVDLNGEYNINRVDYTKRYDTNAGYNCTGNLMDYIIEVRNGDGEWQQVAVGNTVDGTTVITFDAVTATQVRLTATRSYIWSNDNKGMAAAEFAVYKKSECIEHIPGPAATCDTAQTCTECGFVLAAALNHQNAYTRDAVEATLKAPGYTGDRYCPDCDTVLEQGEEIPQLTIKNALPQMDAWNSGIVSLTDCEYVLSGTEGAYSLCHGGNYYVKVAANTNGIPQRNEPYADLTLQIVDGKLRISDGDNYHLHVHLAGSAHTESGEHPWWNKCSSYHADQGNGSHDFYLMKANPDSTNANIPGYEVVTTLENAAGGSYLIAFVDKNNNWFVMYPSTETVSLAKVVGDAVTHTHEYTTTTQDATCTADGLKTDTCSCGHVHTEAIPATGHSYSAVVTAPTCTEQGYTTYTCDCGDSYVADYVDANGHSYNAVVTDPTFEADGYTTYTCACGDSYTEIDEGSMLIAVAKVGDELFETFEEALAAAGEDGTVTLLVPVTVTKDTTYDLGNVVILSDGDAFIAENGAILTLNGGIIEAGRSGVGSWTAVWANGGHVVINGGQYSVGGDSSTTDITHQNDIIYTKNGGTVVINDGWFMNDGTVWTLNENDANRGTITVYGGYFYDWNPADNVSEGAGTSFLAEGYCVEKQDIGDASFCYIVRQESYQPTAVVDPTCTEQGYTTWTCTTCGDSYKDNYVDALGHRDTEIVGQKDATLNEEGYTGDTYCNDCETTIANGEEIPMLTGAVASVNDVKYATFEEALAAAGEDGTVTLLVPVTVTEDTTYDLKNVTITSAGDAFVVTSGTLTLNGDGYVEAGTSNVGSWTAVWANGGHVVINGGTYSVGGDPDAKDQSHQNDVIYTKNGGTVVINGGTFLNDGTVWTLNENDANRGTITVYGGDFQNWNPADNVSEGEHTSFVAEGYCSVLGVENFYIVQAHVEGEAVTENEVDATCSKEGSYDTVVYCSRCNEELSRVTTTVPVGDHSYEMIDGLMKCACGELVHGVYGEHLYNQGVMYKAYQLVNFEGDFYFINDYNKVAKNSTHYLTEEHINGLTFEDGRVIPVGMYEFEADGKMIIPEDKNGVVGDYFYISGVKQLRYQLIEYKGEYYFINDGDKVAKNCTLYLSAKFVEGHTFADGTAIPEGLYKFDENGVMQIPEEEEKPEGIEGDYLYIDGVKQVRYQLIEYKGNYYFINDGDKVAKNCTLYLSERFTDGSVVPVGYYKFDENGVMQIPEKKNGIYNGYLYINDVRQKAYQLVEFDGHIYFVSDAHKVAMGTRVYLSAKFVEGKTFTDGTPIPVGYYEFDANGWMIVD